MKFLCDRCKTRYSIGDDRVRGKILKIRCKNCQNVISVREESYVDAARALGAKPWSVIRKYVFFNVVQNVPPIATNPPAADRITFDRTTRTLHVPD